MPSNETNETVHSDLTPYFAFRIVESWCRKNGRDMGKLTSQTFYGYAKPGKNGAPAVIASYRDASNGDKWMMYGAAFAAWFEDFKAGRVRARSQGDLAALLAEYDV